MWQNIKLYVLAYAVMMAGALASSGFQLLAELFPVGHPVSTISANLSGMTIGGLIMVIGFLRDGRIEEERKRTEEERKRAAAAEARAERAEAVFEQQYALTQAAEARAEAAEARAERFQEQVDEVMGEYRTVVASLLRRLEEMDGRDNNGRSE